MVSDLKTCFILFFFTITMQSCMQPKADPLVIEQAMQNYNRHIISMNVDSIASSYTEDGQLGDIATGRDSIKKFLAKFASFKVLSQVSTTDSISIHQDTATQKGHYAQTVIVPAHDTISVKGQFTATWLLQKNGDWQIKHMETIPSK